MRGLDYPRPQRYDPGMRALISAIKMLTVFPIDTAGKIPFGPVGWMLFWFPAVGLLLGGIGAGVFWAAQQVFPAAVAVLLAILALTLSTGALHVDGLADSADGLFGGRTRERRLEIMRDSRIGTFGVAAVVFVLLFKWTALVGIAGAAGGRGAMAALAAMPMAGRWAILLAAWLCPYAREGEGTGRVFIENATARQFLGAAPIVLVCAWGLLGWGGIVMLAAALPFGLLWTLYAKAKIGGMTGDTLGAVCELSETVFLLSFFVSARPGLLGSGV